MSAIKTVWDISSQEVYKTSFHVLSINGVRSHLPDAFHPHVVHRVSGAVEVFCNRLVGILLEGVFSMLIKSVMESTFRLSNVDFRAPSTGDSVNEISAPAGKMPCDVMVALGGLENSGLIKMGTCWAEVN